MADLSVSRFKEKMSPSSDPISRINGSFSLSAAEAVTEYNTFRKTSSDPISRINESLSRSSSEVITDYNTFRKNSYDPVSRNYGSHSISAAATMADYTCRYDEKIKVSTSVTVSSDYGKLSLSSAEATMTNNAHRSSKEEEESISDTSSRINRSLFPSNGEDVIGYAFKGQKENISSSSDPDSTIHGYLSMSALTLPLEDHYMCQSTEKERISSICDPISNIKQSPASDANYVYRKYEMEETVPSSTSSGINRNLSELLRARSKLNTVLQKCQILEEHLSKSRLHTIAQSMPPLELAFKPMRHHKKLAIDDLSLSIDKIIAPASAVLRAFDALHDLEKSILQDPQHDLLGYINLVSRLEETRSFLLDNCPRTITWLQEMVVELQLRKDEDVIDEQIDACLKKISSQLETLQALQRSGEEASNLDGGLLSEALDRLEDEFQRILAMESSHIIDLASTSPSSSPYNVDSGKLSLETRRNLQLILQKLVMEPDGARRKRCSNIYAAARLKIIRESLKPFPLSYLHLIKSGKKLEWKKIEMHIVSWTKDIEMIVKGVCEAEYHLCSQIFQKKLGYGDLFEEAFSKISAESGLLELLRFGEVSVKTRDEPEKLFKLLDMFEAMNNLRPSFSKIFGAHGCKDVQHKTRDLLKLIAQGAYNIFLELKVQIEKQRELPPAIDGRLPNILTFVSNYVKHLVGDFYRPIMVQILNICEKWKENMSVVVKDNQAANVVKKCSNQSLSRAVLEIVNALVLNLQEWASLCKEEQPVLFHLFLCNNYWYLSVNFQASSELKAMVGEAWINNRMQEHKFHMSHYMEEGWGKIVHNLNVSSATTFTSMSRASARELLKSKLKAFNIEFEDLYEKHKKWVIPDAELREKLCVKVVKRVVPSYATYIQSYGPVLEQDGSRKKYAKYSAQDLERALGSLFQARS